MSATRFEGLAEIAKKWRERKARSLLYHTVKVILPTGETFPVTLSVNGGGKDVFVPGGAAFEGKVRTIEMTLDAKKYMGSPCLYCHVVLPLPGVKDVVPHGWISQVLYTPSNGAVDPASCRMTSKAPKGVPIRWGPMVLRLGMAFCRAFGVDWIGLVDGSFVTKCGSKVKLTDYLLRKGSTPFYERYGFIPVEHWDDYEPLGMRKSHLKRKAELLEAHEDRVAKRVACLQAHPLKCPWCKTKTCKTVCDVKSHLESGKIITKRMDEGDNEACGLLKTLRDAPCMKELMTASMSKKADGDGDMPMVYFCERAPKKRRGSVPPPPPPRKKSLRKSSRKARVAVKKVLGAIRKSRRAVVRKQRRKSHK